MNKLRFIGQKPLMVSILTLLAMVSVDGPLWIVGFSWFLVLFKILSETRNIPPLSRKVTTGLAFLLLGQIYFEFRTYFGQEPSATLLMGLTALKVMDYDSRRDHKYLVVLGFMLLAMKPLFSLDLYWVPGLFMSFVGLWWAMLNPHQRNPLKFLMRLFVISIPATVILFIVFPRVVFPWASRPSNNRAQFGFSEQLNPGGTAALVETDSLVFRARFDDRSFPTMENLYWRGGVLRESYGLTWRPSELDRIPSDSESRTKRTKSSDILTYDIFLEPGNQNYVFALETPKSIKGEGISIRNYESGIFRLNFPQGKTVLYSGISDLGAIDDTVPADSELQIPNLSPKVLAWVEMLKKNIRKGHPEDALEALKEYYVDSKFTYTINPGTYGTNDLDEFLFERKQGFCEHFAGSYATAARALGFPARVIVGFHGGEFNSFGNFWRISTRDAHAWVEVYVLGSWKRVDPTAFAAPTRITRGAFKYFQSINGQGIISSISLTLDEIHAWIESMNYSWTTFLIEFDREGQKDLFSVFRSNLGWVIFAFVLMLILVSILAKAISSKSKELNPYQQLLQEIFAWTAKRGIKREVSQSPRGFLEQVSKTYPQFRDFSERFLNLYEDRFYKNQETTFDKSLRAQWKDIKKS